MKKIDGMTKKVIFACHVIDKLAGDTRILKVYFSFCFKTLEMAMKIRRKKR